MCVCLSTIPILVGTFFCELLWLRRRFVSRSELEGILKVQGLSSVQIRVRAGTEIRQILS